MVRRKPSRIHLRVISSDNVAARRITGGFRSRDRYDDLAVRRLAAVLAAEDTAERHGFSPHARSTCPVHRCWIHQCISDPVHVSSASGHRWCERCEAPVDVDVDESGAGSVRLRCSRCDVAPDSAANREILHACRTSLAAMRDDDDRPTLYPVPKA